MLSLNVVIVALAILFCASKVCSRYPDITSKSYSIPRRIRGNYKVDETTLVYSVCENWTLDEDMSSCTITIEYDVYAYAEPRECDREVNTQIANGKLDILGVELWGREKVLFAWRDLDLYTGKGYLHIEEIEMDDCSVTEQVTRIDLRPDEKSSERIVPSRYSYDVAFLNRDRCGNGICKVTIDQNSQASRPILWFSGTDLIYALQPIQGSSKKLLITSTDGFDGRARIYLLDDNEKTLLTSHRYTSQIGWSSTYGTVTVCYFNTCLSFKDNGELQQNLTLTNVSPYYPSAYKALYNLPNGELLALVCYRSSNSVHQIIKIGINGEQNYSLRLDELNCYPEPRFLTTSLYMKNRREYCLSLFHSINQSYSSLQFSTYCMAL